MILKGNMTHQIVFHQLQGVASFEQSSLNLFLNMVYLKENSYFLCQRELKDRGNIYYTNSKISEEERIYFKMISMYVHMCRHVIWM